MGIVQEFKTTKELLLHVLKEYPETRNSDTVLYLTCCQVLGVTTLEQAKNLDLNMISVHKMRQQIQNKDGMYKPDVEVQKSRKTRATQAREFMGAYDSLKTEE